MSQSTPVHATEAAAEISPIHAAPQVDWVLCFFLLRSMLSYWCWLVLFRIWNCTKQGVGEFPSTARRAAAVSPNEQAAWDDADDGLLVSSVFLLQRMFAGFRFMGNMHNARCGLDSPSNLPVPNHGATSVPSRPHILET